MYTCICRDLVERKQYNVYNMYVLSWERKYIDLLYSTYSSKFVTWNEVSIALCYMYIDQICAL